MVLNPPPGKRLISFFDLFLQKCNGLLPILDSFWIQTVIITIFDNASRDSTRLRALLPCLDDLRRPGRQGETVKRPHQIHFLRSDWPLRVFSSTELISNGIIALMFALKGWVEVTSTDFFVWSNPAGRAINGKFPHR
jgi:hypothetical protein